MPKAISNVAVNTHTFSDWISYFNLVADHMTNNVISIGTEATGDANVNGIIYSVGFQSNTLVCNVANVVDFSSNTMQANVATIANGTGNFTTLTVNSNAAWHGGNFDPNTKITSSDVVSFSNNISFDKSIIINSSSIGAYSQNLTATTANLITSFTVNTYTSSKLLITSSNPTTNNYSTTEVLIVTDATNVWLTEYAQIHSNNSVGSISANIDTGTLRVWYTPVAASNTTVSYQEILL